jgi:prevent-host-death family protein
MSMIKVAASRIKAKMGEYMRAVRDGQEVVITDRERPVARLVPYDAGTPPPGPALAPPRDPAAPPLGRLEVRALRYRGTDTTALLREDRDRR